jgi:hypothetical protein
MARQHPEPAHVAPLRWVLLVAFAGFYGLVFYTSLRGPTLGTETESPALYGYNCAHISAFACTH